MTEYPRVIPEDVQERESPWKLGGLTISELARRVWNEIGKDEVVDRAAALSYYFLFALFPALLFLTTLLGLLPVENLIDRLLEYVSQALPGDAASMLEKTLHEIIRGARGGLLSIGVLAALWAGSNGMGSIINALNVAYEVQDPRPWWHRRLVAIVLTLVFSVLTIAALVLLVFGGKIGDVLGRLLGIGSLLTVAWKVIQWPAAIFFVMLAVSLVYYLAPAVKQRWHWVTPGSAVAVVVWVAMSVGLRLYVTHFANYNATYGSIGGVILLMLWLYLSGLILLVGAETNSEIQRAAAARRAAGRAAPRADAPRARPPANQLEDDFAVAGRALEQAVRTAYQRGWTPVVAVISAAFVGRSLSRRPLAEVAATADGVVRSSLQLIAAVAAVERFRKKDANPPPAA